MAKVAVRRSGGENHRVVRDPRTVLEDYRAAGHVNIFHFAQQNFRVLLPVQDITKGRRDFAGRQGSRRDLIKQGLKEMEITPVNQGEVNVRVFERTGSVKSAEPASDNDDAVGHYLHDSE